MDIPIFQGREAADIVPNKAFPKTVVQICMLGGSHNQDYHSLGSRLGSPILTNCDTSTENAGSLATGCLFFYPEMARQDSQHEDAKHGV